jgi:hypothetical protein
MDNLVAMPGAKLDRHGKRQSDSPGGDVHQRERRPNRRVHHSGPQREYPVPAGSTWDAEIAKCVQYGKDALLG